MTLSEIKLATFRLVAQCLNQMQHRLLQTCVAENETEHEQSSRADTHTHTHTHIYIYIYIYILDFQTWGRPVQSTFSDRILVVGERGGKNVLQKIA
jgi:hypothetical protein